MPRERDADIIRVLISTDNHLGYLEKDLIRGDDSFRAFEEVLALAKANRVDMVLLGGDLFHENKPSRRTLVRTMATLRAHCLGDDPVALAVRSNPRDVNYMDSSYAISLPIFVIHGNHDDCTGAAGAEALSALDILAQANLVTYFGKAPDSRKINVMPILLQKGLTKLALYGLGNVRDDVLYETWVNAKQVHWLCPSEKDEDDGGVNWFSLFVIHQNRAFRGTAKAITDTVLPKWLDYVVWGHEHDSLPDLTKTRPPIVQPGSTVATSLSHGESLPKHVIMLEIKCGAMKHRIIPLQTVRNFHFDEVALGDKQHSLSVGDTKGVESFLLSRVESMIQEQEAAFDQKRAAFESGEGPSVQGVRYPPNEFYLSRLSRVLRQPLIRLRVEYSGGFDTLNPQRFGQAFVGRVATATEMLHFFKKRKPTTKPFMHGMVSSRSRGGDASLGEDAADGTGDGLADGESEALDVSAMGDGGEDETAYDIPNLVEYFLYHREAGGAGLKFLELDKLKVAVEDFVLKAEPRAITDYVSAYLKVQQDKTLDAQERRGAVLTDKELTEGFKSAAERAAKKVLSGRREVANGADGGKDENAEKAQDREKSRASEAADRKKPKARNAVEDRGDDDESGEDIEDGDADRAKARFDAVQAMLSRNPATAGVTQAARNTVRDEMPLSDEYGDSEDDLPPQASGRGSRGRAKSRGGRAQTARGGRAATRTSRARPAPMPSRSRATSRRSVADEALPPDEDDGPSARAPSRAATRPPSRRAAAAVQSYLEDDDDDDVEAVDPSDDVVIEDSVDEEPPVRSRKRKSTSAGSAPSTRPRSRARTAARPSSRARLPTDTIDLGDSDD